MKLELYFSKQREFLNFNPSPDGLFWGCSWVRGWRGAQKVYPPLNLSHILTIMKLGTVIPYRKKIYKIYKSCDTSLEFC